MATAPTEEIIRVSHGGYSLTASLQPHSRKRCVLWVALYKDGDRGLQREFRARDGEHDIRHAVGRPPTDADLVGADSRLALDEMTASMPFVVAKKGQAPAGARVLITLTGPVAREIRVAVEGRAALVEDFGGAQPTVGISLDGLQFARLAGGRPLMAGRTEGIDYAGDTAAGARIIENLNYVI
jgi:hypothetical protein